MAEKSLNKAKNLISEQFGSHDEDLPSNPDDVECVASTTSKDHAAGQNGFINARQPKTNSGNDIVLHGDNSVPGILHSVMNCIKAEATEELLQILSVQSDVNELATTLDDTGWSLFTLAAELGNQEIVTLLIREKVCEFC